MTDFQALGLFASLLLASVALGEGLRVIGWRPESSRRVVHVGVGLTVACCPVWFDSPIPIYGLAAVFAAGNAVALGLGWFQGMHGIRRRSVGTVVFPVALIVALALCWSLDPGRVYVLQVAFAVLALADPAASLAGARVPRPLYYTVAGAQKSVAGSAAFALVALIASGGVLAAVGPEPWTVGTVLGASASVALLATAAEALGRGGWDNLWIVLAVIVPLSALDGGASVEGHLLAAVLAVAFGVATWWVRALDVSGALAATLLAWLLVAVGGVQWAVPSLMFFVGSSALSRLGRARKARAQSGDQKGSRRDVGQVLANGGVGLAALAATVFVPAPALYGAFVGAFAAATADTWGTEIGTLTRGATRLLGVGRRVAPGTSGGMSLPGSAGLVLGAAVVVGSAVLASPAWPGAGVALALVVVASMAAVLDSALGATVQARFAAPGGRLAEVPSAEGQAPARGVRWVDNDVVNWGCTLAGGAGGAAVWAWLA